MPKKKLTRHPEDRAAEYIDSPRMTQRLRRGKNLSARIAGNYGTYRTQTQIGKRSNGDCTCPSEQWPCKHIRALAATWDCNPESFFDLESFLEGLAGRAKTELLELIAEMALAAPESLRACGVTEFEEDEEYYDEYD